MLSVNTKSKLFKNKPIINNSSKYNNNKYGIVKFFQQKCFSNPKCKVALITGAEGIGFACANQLLKQGARGVGIVGLDSKTGAKSATILNNSYGRGKAFFCKSNINCTEQFEEAFRIARREYNNVDIVINAAGIFDGHRWEKEVVTNLIGTIRGTLLGYRYMSLTEGRGNGGIIINISGISGLEPLSSAPTLTAEHHGIIGLSRSFGDANNTNKTGVRVVCLCPGFTATKFLQKVKEKAMSPDFGLELQEKIAKSKAQRPEAIGKAIPYLITHATSGSVWAVEGASLYHVYLPPLKSYLRYAGDCL